MKCRSDFLTLQSPGEIPGFYLNHITMKQTFLFLITIIIFSSCTENYSNGERIGLVTKFSKNGIIWKSWEGHLNQTQTGMNSSTPFDFSIDNDNEPKGLVNKLDSAARYGWKVKLVYHRVFFKNWFGNRGETNYFITSCDILDRAPVQSVFENPNSGKVVDTIYVVIQPEK